MTRAFAVIMALMAGLGLSPAGAGFRSPESLVRNVYAYYGHGESELSQGLPHDTATAEQFFDSTLRAAGFAPEVLSRIDRIFVFEPLAGLDIARVAALEI